MNNSIINTLKVTTFPEESMKITSEGKTYNVEVYGERSYMDYLAMLSHYLNNTDILNDEEKEVAADFIRKYITALKPDYTEEISSMVCENLVELSLFEDLFDVPFHNPKNPDFTFIDLFAGIGGIRLPFTELNGRCVFSSEWDKAACQTYASNYGEIPFGDITKISETFIPPHDVLLAGFPCQAFSIIGKMKGFEDTRGTMFFEVARILKYHHPKAILLENVKQLVSHDKGKTFEVILQTLADLGYHVKWQVLNALDFGLPQKRERVIIVGFTDEKNAEMFNFNFERKPYNLADILENDEDVDPSLFASEMIQQKRQQSVEGKNIFYPSCWHENKSGNISVLPYACALRTGASYNYQLINGYRRPSSRELLRLQGFPDEYRIAVSHGEIRRQTGNSVAVPIIRAIAKKIVNILCNNQN